MGFTYTSFITGGAAAASATFSASTAAAPIFAVASVTSAATAAAATVVAATAAAVPAAAASAIARAGSSTAAASVRAAGSAVSLGSSEKASIVAAMAMPMGRGGGILYSSCRRECQLFPFRCNNGAASAIPFFAASRSNVLHIPGRVFAPAPSSQRLLIVPLGFGFSQWPAAAYTSAAHRAVAPQAAKAAGLRAAVCLHSRGVCDSCSVCWLNRRFSSCTNSSAGSAAGGSSRSSSGSHPRSGGGSSWSSSHRSSSAGRGSSRQQRREGSSRGGGSGSSFIRSILQQVKTDMEENEELQKAMKELKASQLTQKSVNVGQRMQNAATAAAARAKKVLGSTQQLLNTAAEQAAAMQQQLQEKRQQASEKHPAFKELQTAVGRVSEGLRTAVTKIEFLSSSLFQDDENDAEKKAAQWQQQMAIRRYKQQQREKQRQQQQQMQEQQQQKQTPNSSDSTSTTTGAATAAGQQQQEPSQKQQQTRYQASAADEDEEEQPVERALVVSQRTTWDRFGSRLREMPFLQNFLDNPLVSQLFGETEIAASIREMKTLDPKFKLPELHNLVERVVASHVVQAFLLGDEETLALHCGEGAFAALRASILERRVQRVRLDSEILQLGNVDLVGARRSLSPPTSAAAVRSSEEVPWFIYTFSCQQINCLRSEIDGKVVEGRPDDIRRVLYSIAISRHPKPEAEGLLYPWMIQEIAIVGSEAVW